MRKNQAASGADEALLKEIRDHFSYCKEAWRDIRAEGAKDMKYLAGDPWDPKERKQRQDARRPCLTMDELNQYVNQLINDVRQNKRSIRVNPAGNGSSEQTAELRQGIIRQIEYASQAQAAYTTGFENAAQRSYGVWGVTTKYEGERTFNQVLRIRRIPNPDSVYFDPDAREADYSDGEYAFEFESILQQSYKERYPNAEVKDFGDAQRELAPLWIGMKHVQVASYWKVVKARRELLGIDDPKAGFIAYYADELPDGMEQDGDVLVSPGMTPIKISKRRQVETKKVRQYITNGLEILEQKPWAGSWIPLVPVIGKELYVGDDDNPKRVLLSLIRLARDPYMLYCYYRTCEAELVAMTPKTPFVGYEGQFEGHEDEWKKVHQVGMPYLQVKPVMDATGQNVLPIPQRQPYEPQIQPLEMGAEAAKRAIQSAMGRYNTSVGRADSKATSGIAIKALDSQSDQGSFHFIDNFDRALEHTGRILNELIPIIYDSEREVGIRKPDESYAVVKMNGTQGQTGEGDHEVTISTGPSYQSQREEAADFATQLANTPLFPKVADLIVKLKNLGPIGDEIAERLMPPEFAGKEPLTPGAQKIVGELQQQVKQMHAYAQSLEGQVGKLSAEKQAKLLELASKERIAFMQGQVDLLKAEITAKKDVEGAALLERLKAEFTSLQNNEQRDAELELALAQAQTQPGAGAAPQDQSADQGSPAGAPAAAAEGGSTQ